MSLSTVGVADKVHCVAGLAVGRLLRWRLALLFFEPLVLCGCTGSSSLCVPCRVGRSL